MCLDPVSATALALTAGGALVNGYEQNKQAKKATQARNAATQAELARQRQHQANSALEFNSALDLFSPTQQPQNLAATQADTGGVFADNAPTAEMIGSIGTGAGPRVVQDEETKRTGAAMGKNAADAAAWGNLVGYDQLNLGNRFGINDAGRKIDLTSNFSRGSQGVNALEQQVDYQNALNANAPSGIGDLMQFAGTMAGFGAGSGGFPGMSSGAGKPLNLFNFTKPGIVPTAAASAIPRAAATLPRIY